MSQTLFRLKTYPVVGVVAFSILAGCRGEEVEPTGAAVQNSVEASQKAEAQADEPVREVDAGGRKWLTPDIPYDVFEGLPSADEIAARAAGSERGGELPPRAMETGSFASAESAAPGASEGPAEPPAPVISPPSGGGEEKGWDDILPLGVLQAEIASVRNRLGERLLTVGTYNGAFEEVANAGWEMSALVTIVSEHPGSISWKDQALYARDAAVGVAMAATGRGRENFNAAQLSSEQLFAIQNNNAPAGLSEPDPEASREETADRAALMARMQLAFDRLEEIGGGDAASLQSDPIPAIQEARLLAALAKFTADDDYTAAENEDYQTAAKEIVASGGLLSSAVESGDLDEFRSTLDRIDNACNQCHTKYRVAN